MPRLSGRRRTRPFSKKTVDRRKSQVGKIIEPQGVGETQRVKLTKNQGAYLREPLPKDVKHYVGEDDIFFDRRKGERRKVKRRSTDK